MVQFCHTFLIILKALEEQVTKLLTYYALFVTIYLPKIILLNKYKRKENICVNFYLFYIIFAYEFHIRQNQTLISEYPSSTNI